MKACVFHKPKDIRCENVPDPIIKDSRDAIIRVTATAICGSDLHIYNGFIPQTRPLTLGHEFMGIVEDVGKDVTNLKRGDRVVVPFPIACGRCWFCDHALPGHCETSNPEKYGPEGAITHDKGGALFGYTDLYGGYDGGQAEAVRVPFADVSPRKVPDALTDEQVLFLTDIFPTGWSGVAEANPQPGMTYAVFGCGPVGLMAMKAAWLHGAGRVIGVDILPYRLNMAHQAANAEVINASQTDAVEIIRQLTDGRGVDICIDAVGLEAHRSVLDKVNAALHLQRGSDKALTECFRAVRRGGTVSILGVYGNPYDNFPIDKIFEKAIRIYAGQAPVINYIDHLIELIANGKVKTDDIITHRLPLADVGRGYDIFCEKKEDCVKVVLTL